MKAVTADNGIAGEPLSEESGFPRTPSASASANATADRPAKTFNR